MKLSKSILYFGIFLSLGGSLSAQTLYWDTNGATAGAGNPADGTWDLDATANWTTDSTGSIATSIYSAGADVIFSAGSDAATANITVSGTQDVSSMTFKNGNVTLSGSSIDELSGSVTVTVDSGATATFNNTNTFNGNFVVNGTLNAHIFNAGGPMTKSGTGTMTINRMDATLTVNEGTVIYTGTSGAKLKNTTINDTGTLRITGTALESGRSLVVNSGGVFEIATGVSQTINGYTMSGTTVSESGATLTVNGTGAISGSIEGELNFISGGTSTKSFTDTSSMEFTIGANGVNNSILGDGTNNTTTNLDGTFTFDLSGADLSDGNSWLIVDVDALDETFGATFNIASFTDGGSDVWTYDSDTNLSFSEATGYLSYTVIPEPGTYAALFGAVAGLLIIRRHRR
ncbi:PEP-CTERM sorting domain-containing protein [Cerasicoccus maritimus]|uniref:PEP-CTERM sorting domain-containing protein n=1 Tax=Cerasicoccus maritimus TaxID=490089 RepID=UPI0028528CC0|nr:PEP-CTERM sorting domain-containing protein [Cerasicoccus maritimus]